LAEDAAELTRCFTNCIAWSGKKENKASDSRQEAHPGEEIHEIITVEVLRRPNQT
jgi:hypothetical protein